VAVAVEQAQYIVLDEEFRIAEVAPSAQASFGPLLGKCIFEAFPESEQLFRPHYERALRMRAPVEFATFYDGHALRLRVHPHGLGVHVSWQDLARLDVLTLDGLVNSLDAALAAIADAERELEHDRARERLRVVGGDR